MSNEHSGLEEAREERRKAEAELEEVRAQRPLVKRLEDSAIRIRFDDQVAQLTMLAIRGGRA